MQHRSKLSKSRFSAPPSTLVPQNFPGNQPSGTPLLFPKRKSGFFAQLFNKQNTLPVPQTTSNLAIPNLLPDLLSDPAFSPDPLTNPESSHPLYVSNPDSQPPPPAPLSHSPSFASPYPSSLSHNLHYSSIFDPPPPMGTNISSSSQSSPTEAITSFEPSPASSRSDIPSSASINIAGKLTQKNLLVLEPPRIMSPPPAYDDHRPPTFRHASVPALPSSQPEPVEVPPRPATTANASSSANSHQNSTEPSPHRHNRGLDPIDELDETNPLGLSLHHGGPYEAIKQLSQSPSEQQVNSNQHPVARKKPANRQLLPANSSPAVPVVPFGASLNLAPGQILPRNFQPYTQLPPQRQNQLNSYRQQNNPNRPMQHYPNQPTNRRQENQQPSSVELLPSQSHLQPPTHLNTQFLPASAPHPSIDDAHSVYGDETDAYGGIEEEEEHVARPDTSSNYASEAPAHHHESSLSSKFDPVQLPQHHSGSDTAISMQDDAVARALYAVERARSRKGQSSEHIRHGTTGPPSGFSAFNDGPSTAPYQPPAGHQAHISREQVQNPSMSVPHNTSTYHSDVPLRHNSGPSADMFSPQPPRHRPQDTGRPAPPAAQYSSQRMDPYPQSHNLANAPFDPRNVDRPARSIAPAPSIQQSVSSTASRNGPLPRHIPTKLTMPQPLYNPNAPATQHNNLAEQPRNRFQPPHHGTGMNRPIAQNHTSRGSPAPDPARVQAQNIPMGTDSRKVLRKRASLQATSSSRDVPATTTEMPEWLAPRPSILPSRSKSELRPPATGTRMPPPPMPKDKKAPKRLLSKKRTEF